MKKICNYCNKEKEERLFFSRACCKACERKSNKLRWKTGTGLKSNKLHYTCNYCLQKKHKDEFENFVKGVSRRKCRECEAKANKKLPLRSLKFCGWCGRFRNRDLFPEVTERGSGPSNARCFECTKWRPFEPETISNDLTEQSYLQPQKK